MIVSIIIIIFFTVAISFAVRVSTTEGMVFEKIGKYAEGELDKGHKYWEALVLCPYCVVSTYSLFGGLTFFLVTGSFDYHLLFAWPVIIGFSSLVHGMVWSVFELLWAKKAYYEKEEERVHYIVKDMKDNYYKNKIKQNGDFKKSNA